MKNAFHQPSRAKTNQLLRIMRFFSIFLASCSLHVSARSVSQTVTFSATHASIELAFKAIEQQTGFTVAYNADIVAQARAVTLQVYQVQLTDFLGKLAEDQPFHFLLKQSTIFIAQNQTAQPSFLNDRRPLDPITGSVTDSAGHPLYGATIFVKGTRKGTSSDPDGKFSLSDVPADAMLSVSYTGCVPQVVPIAGQHHLSIVLQSVNSSLDQIQVIAYGSITKRLNTGSVTTVTSETISQQPVSNPLAALEGRVPGMIVTQSSGVPGSSFSAQIRGKTSIDSYLSDDQPLFIIDGVPAAANNGAINQGNVGSAIGAGGMSPFNSLNASDIESIEVLKDADATAIYGSRGANGVVLITTKKAKSSANSLNGKVYQGFGRVTRLMPLLTTSQYVQMRHEAYKNDSVTPDHYNAFDILDWDTTRYTDMQHLMIGGTAKFTNAQVSYSEGSANTQFLLSGSFNRETTVFPSDQYNQNGSLHVNINHQSTDKKFNLGFTTNYSAVLTKLAVSDLTSATFSPPNMLFHDSTGKLAWGEKGFDYGNPLAALQQPYHGRTDNLVANLQLGYQAFSWMTLRANAGYNNIRFDEYQLNPSITLDPAYQAKGSSSFGNNKFTSWIFEPQAEITRKLLGGKTSVLFGATLQKDFNDGGHVFAYGFSSDALLRSVGAASLILERSSNYFEYRYGAVFGRFNYNLSNKYLLNFSVRRDASSRFGPGRQFSNFWSAAGAWIFSEEPGIRTLLPWLSFGKFRASVGTTGNDKIGNYNYLDSYIAAYPYNGSDAIYPYKLSNRDFGWETSRKLEAAFELGFWKDRFLITVDHYRMSSSNQLISYVLPSTTGFSSVVRNLDALILNTGFEISLQSQLIRSKTFSWKSSVTATLPRSKVKAFPGLADSYYRYSYVIGEPTGILYNYRSNGVDPQTGVYTVLDVNKDGQLNDADNVISARLGPRAYGGFSNTFSVANWELTVFFEGRLQTGTNYLNNNSFAPGVIHNQPAVVLNRWQKPGDISDIQKFTATYGTPAYDAIQNNYYLSASYSDASFVRLKNLYLSYSIPLSSTKALNQKMLHVFVQGQNLFVITKYRGADPETQSLYSLPPLKVLTAGIQFTL